MNKSLALLTITLLIGCATAIDYQAYENQIQEIPKACSCLGPWLGGKYYSNLFIFSSSNN